jgi:apolipoprotein N-acyltransferase
VENGGSTATRSSLLDPKHVSAIASGLLLAGAFPPLDQGWLAWLALVPILWSIRDASPGTAFRLGYLAGLIWFGVVLYWITLFGLLAWAALIAFMALYMGGFAALLRWLSREHPRWHLLLIPVVWGAVEVVRSTGPLGFPWALLGSSQYPSCRCCSSQAWAAYWRRDFREMFVPNQLLLQDLKALR